MGRSTMAVPQAGLSADLALTTDYNEVADAPYFDLVPPSSSRLHGGPGLLGAIFLVGTGLTESSASVVVEGYVDEAMDQRLIPPTTIVPAPSLTATDSFTVLVLLAPAYFPVFDRLYIRAKLTAGEATIDATKSRLVWRE